MLVILGWILFGLIVGALAAWVGTLLVDIGAIFERLG